LIINNKFKRKTPLGLDMGIRSINLNNEADTIYQGWMKYRHGSKQVSAAIINYKMKDEYLPLLRDGDRRISVTGQELQWREGEGWELVE